MPAIPALIVAGGAIVGGAMSANAQSSAARRAAASQSDAAITAAQIQADQADRALALQERTYQDQRSMYAPAATLGAGALARQYIMAGGDQGRAQQYYSDQTRALNGQPGEDPGLAGYTANSWMTTDPGYAFRRDQGSQALERRASATGRYYAPSTDTALLRYNQDYASNEFMNAFNRLGAISGTGQTATQNIGNAGQNYSNQATGTLQYSGDAQAGGVMGAGNARASGYLASGNAWGNFWGNTVPGAIGMAAGRWG